MADDEARAIVRADYLIAAEPFQATEETRFYLNGLRIARRASGAAEIAATNGLLLCVIRDAGAIVLGPPTTWSVPWRATFGAPAKAWRRDARAVAQSHTIFADLRRSKSGTEARLVAALTAKDVLEGRGEEILSKKGAPDGIGPKTASSIWIDGGFPLYDRVIAETIRPKPADGKPAWFDAPVMAKLTAFAAALSDLHGVQKTKAASSKPYAPMALHQASPGAASVVRFATDDAFALIMPCAPGDLPKQIDPPAWFAEVEPEQAPPLALAA